MGYVQRVQASSPGVNEILFQEFVESEIILTRAKGIVGLHLAEYPRAPILCFIRGIMHFLRRPNWDVKVRIRQEAWELVDPTIGIVGLDVTPQEPLPEDHTLWRMLLSHPMLLEDNRIRTNGSQNFFVRI